MTFLEALIFGLVQGLTEFLPVSSSGHLVLVKSLMEITEPGMVFEIFVHFGTVLSILVVFRKEVVGLIRGFFILLFTKKESVSAVDVENGHMAWYIILGTIPAAIVGFTLKDQIEALFFTGDGSTSILFVSIMLIVTGIILFLTRYTVETGKKNGWYTSLIIGIGQAIAILPGISRSGTTIGIAMFFGIEKKKAAQFSFLLAIPVIIGATLKQTLELLPFGIRLQEIWLPLFTATTMAFVSGYFAILFLLDIIKRGKFSYFAYYCWLVGLAGLISVV